MLQLPESLRWQLLWDGTIWIYLNWTDTLAKKKQKPLCPGLHGFSVAEQLLHSQLLTEITSFNLFWCYVFLFTFIFLSIWLWPLFLSPLQGDKGLQGPPGPPGPTSFEQKGSQTGVRGPQVLSHSTDIALFLSVIKQIIAWNEKTKMT